MDTWYNVCYPFYFVVVDIVGPVRNIKHTIWGSEIPTSRYIPVADQSFAKQPNMECHQWEPISRPFDIKSQISHRGIAVKDILVI